MKTFDTTRIGRIVLTSIRPPTRQVEAFTRQTGWETIFVADLKTPEFSSDVKLYLLTVNDQKNGSVLGQILPWNHYARKNLGYLYAVSQDSSFIFDTDDDNLPLEPWTPWPDESNILSSVGGQKWVNVYAHFGGGHVWPRGFPLQHIGSCEAPITEQSSADNVVVWQGLVGGDPDVDAIFRLTRPDAVQFQSAKPLVLPSGNYCPFNSQNTLWKKPAFPYLYLPSTVTFRFTDILRGLVAQRCFWAHGWQLGFQGITAFQERNPHDLLIDFRDEIPCYLFTSQVAKLLDSLELGHDPMNNLHLCYEALLREKIVLSKEMAFLEGWLNSLIMQPA